MTRRGQASIEAILLAVMLVALAIAGVRLAGRLPVAAGRAVQAEARARPAPPPRNRIAAAGGVAALALRLASLGIRESAPNAGPFIDDFTDGHPEPWCADFVSWVLASAGSPLTGGASGGWRIAGALGLRTWFARRRTWTDRSAAQPLAGDVVVFGHGHAGIVVATGLGSLETVEGNAGDAVAVRRYPAWRSNGDIAGFGHP